MSEERKFGWSRFFGRREAPPGEDREGEGEGGGAEPASGGAESAAPGVAVVEGGGGGTEEQQRVGWFQRLRVGLSRSSTALR